MCINAEDRKKLEAIHVAGSSDLSNVTADGLYFGCSLNIDLVRKPKVDTQGLTLNIKIPIQCFAKLLRHP